MELGFTYTSPRHELHDAQAEHEAWKARQVQADDNWRRKLQRNAEIWDAWAEYMALGQAEEPPPPPPVWEPALPLQ